MFSKLKEKKIESSFSLFIRKASSGEKKRVYKSVLEEAARDQARVVKSMENGSEPDIPHAM